MARVTFQTADDELRREEKGITFWASNGDGQIGWLVVSKGGLRWYSGKSNKRHTFVTWEQLNERIAEIGKSGA